MTDPIGMYSHVAQKKQLSEVCRTDNTELPAEKLVDSPMRCAEPSKHGRRAVKGCNMHARSLLFKRTCCHPVAAATALVLSSTSESMARPRREVRGARVVASSAACRVGMRQ